MNTMIQHINDLLFLHDCVVLPEFGGIISNYTSSHFDEKSLMFYPPKKELAFNKNLFKNDGLLISYITEKDGMSYEKASKCVSYFIEDLKVKLNQGQRVVFENVGVFFCDRKFNILFEPSDYNFLSDSWGMNELTLDAETYNKVSKVTKTFGKKLKLGMAAAAFGGAVYVVGSNIDNVNINKVEASIGVGDLFKASGTDTNKPEISPEDEIIDYNPFKTK